MCGHPMKKKTTPIHMHDDECWECERVFIKCSINLKTSSSHFIVFPFSSCACSHDALILKRTFSRFYHDFIEGNWRRIKSSQRKSRYVTETNGGSKMMQSRLRYNLIVITKKQIVATERVELFGKLFEMDWNASQKLLTCFTKLISSCWRLSLKLILFFKYFKTNEIFEGCFKTLLSHQVVFIIFL